MTTLLLLAGSYIVGSIPFGLILGKLFCGVDLREVGSGNIGASNAWRVLGWRVGLPVFALDLAKGFVPVWITRRMLGNADDWIIVAAGIAAILGHNFSPFLGFKGGKGVATSFGVALGMSWKAGLAGFGVWAILLGLTRYISISSMIGTAVGAAGIWIDNGRSLPFGLFGILATVFVIVKHKSNIQRLRNGTEPKVELKR